MNITTFESSTKGEGMIKNTNKNWKIIEMKKCRICLISHFVSARFSIHVNAKKI